jgi:hypothetical protein
LAVIRKRKWKRFDISPSGFSIMKTATQHCPVRKEQKAGKSPLPQRERAGVRGKVPGVRLSASSPTPQPPPVKGGGV